MADKKLTLSIDANIIEQAKKLAARKGSSLSNIVENVLLGMISMNSLEIPFKKTSKKSLVDEIFERAPHIDITDEEIREFKVNRLLKKHS